MFKNNRPVPLLAMGVAGMLLLLLALAAQDRPLFFCWPTFLLALAGLTLLVLVAFVQARDENA